MPFPAPAFFCDEPDTLADAPNRPGLERALSRAVAEDVPVGLIFVTIDAFQVMREAHGRALCDRVLAGLSRLLREHSRKGDFVARYGNDEYVVLLRGASDDFTTELAARIGQAVKECVSAGALPAFGVAIGTATREPGSGEPAEVLLSRGELARGRGKLAGEEPNVNAPGLAKTRSEVAQSGAPGAGTCTSAA